MRVGASRLRRRAGPRAGQVPRAAGPRRALDAHPVALLDRPRPLRPVPAFRGDHRGGDRLTAATATATATATPTATATATAGAGCAGGCCGVPTFSSAPPRACLTRRGEDAVNVERPQRSEDE